MKIWHWILIALVTVASIVVELMERYGHHDAAHGAGHTLPAYMDWPFFWIVFGSLGCALLIILGKKILGPIIYKKEDYYNG